MQATGGRVSLTVFGGGSQGDEPTVLRKMRLDALQAASLTGVGLGTHRRVVQRLRRAVLLRVVRRAQRRHRRSSRRRSASASRRRASSSSTGATAGGRSCSPRSPCRRVADLKKAQAVHVGRQRSHGAVVQGQRLRAARNGDDRHHDRPDDRHGRSACRRRRSRRCCSSGTGRRRTCSISASRPSSARPS